jgi:hypothetical protein
MRFGQYIGFPKDKLFWWVCREINYSITNGAAFGTEAGKEVFLSLNDDIVSPQGFIRNHILDDMGTIEGAWT